jgi:hypothetical protein
MVADRPSIAKKCRGKGLVGRIGQVAVLLHAGGKKVAAPHVRWHCTN